MLRRKTVEKVIYTTDGIATTIGWRDAEFNQPKCDPFIESLDVRVTLEGAEFRPQAERPG